MRAWAGSLILVAMTAACGGGDTVSPGPAAAHQDAERAVAAILAGDRETQAPAVCELLRSGLVSEVFAVDEVAVNYRPGSKVIPHPLCVASWDAPDKAELEAACSKEMIAHSQRRTAAAVARKPFDEQMPTCIHSNHATEVTLTVTNLVFDSAAAAVESLESTVVQLEEGMTITVQGKERTTQIDFDDWLEGVGDKAAWAPRMSELSVAAGGVRFAVTVRGTGDASTNRDKAIELARRVSGAL